MIYTKEDEDAAIIALTHLGSHVAVTPRSSPNELDSVELEPEAVCETSAKFPLKLFDILNEEKYENILRWLPEGNGFYFLDKKRFEREILPLFFQKHTKFTSFTRRLIRWGFVRIPKGSFIGSYFHFLFHKGKRSLCVELCNRLRNKTVVKLKLNKSLTNICTLDESESSSHTEPEHSTPDPNILLPDDRKTSPENTVQKKRSLLSSYYSHKEQEEERRMARKFLIWRVLEQKRRRVLMHNHYLACMKAAFDRQGYPAQLHASWHQPIPQHITLPSFDIKNKVHNVNSNNNTSGIYNAFAA